MDNVKEAQEMLFNMGYEVPSLYDEKFLDKLSRYARHDRPVLIYGETGTGKDLIANCIHNLSDKKSKPFLPLNCNMSSDLIESELFGYKKGAFTGATVDKKGIFEEADEGTVFLDEIADMPEETQAKILRVLNNGKYRPVGATTEETTQARIICASNRDLKKTGFRDDLYYRINTLKINLPSLNTYLKDSRPDHRRVFFSMLMHNLKLDALLTEKAMNKLCSHNWTGNFRELANVLINTFVLNEGNNPSGKVILKTKSKTHIVKGVTTFIDATHIEFDMKTETMHDTKDIPLLKIVDYAKKEGDKLKASIVESKVRQVLSSGKDLKTALLEEGISEREYQNQRKKIITATGKNLKDI